MSSGSPVRGKMIRCSSEPGPSHWIGVLADAPLAAGVLALELVEVDFVLVEVALALALRRVVVVVVPFGAVEPFGVSVPFEVAASVMVLRSVLC
jgi:hypothetical protein